MAFSVLQTVNRKRYNAGTRDVGSWTVPLGITRLRLRFTRDGWPDDINTRVVDGVIEISLDAGVNWEFRCGFSANGGTHIMRDGFTVLPESTITFGVPDPLNPLRQIRASLVIHNPLFTEVTVEGES